MARYTHQDQYTVVGINNEFEKIEQAFKDMLSRVGDSDNALEADIDANSSRIFNLPEPLSNSEPLTLGKGQAILDDATAEANRALAQANRAEEEADRAESAASTAAADTEAALRFEFTSLKDAAQTAATQSGVAATESQNSAIAAQDAELTLQSFIDDYASNNLVFPFDMGQITDTMIANQFDLGSIA